MSHPHELRGALCSFAASCTPDVMMTFGLRRALDFWKLQSAFEMFMNWAGAAGGGVPPARKGAAEQPATDGLGHLLAAHERREVACLAGGVWAVVDGGPDLHPLVPARRVGTLAHLILSL
jgi:hypothetical protein